MPLIKNGLSILLIDYSAVSLLRLRLIGRRGIEALPNKLPEVGKKKEPKTNGKMEKYRH